MAAEGEGISRPLSEQVNLLGAMLGEAIREQAGDEMFAALAEDPEAPGSFHRRIADDFAAAAAAIAAVTGRDGLLAGTPVIRRSIALRNPYTDVLNLVQVELLRRCRDADGERRDDLRRALYLSINAIAAALQATG